MSPAHEIAKTAFDRTASLLALVLLAPLFALLALLVKFGDGGNVFFTQERIGKDGKPFRILKFRSMRAVQEQGAAQITVSGDDRITAIGRILRKTKLDELPQLLNVLRGEMSFVGPRPEVPKYVARYTEAQRRALSVRPGITDWATLHYRNEESILAASDDPERLYLETVLPEKLRLSLEYLDRASFAGDLGILWLTFLRLFDSGEKGGKGEI